MTALILLKSNRYVVRCLYQDNNFDMEMVMDYEQIAGFQPALAELLDKFRHCFKREKTFGHWQRYILGLMADLKRKSIEPIALSAGVAVRTLQEFLAFFNI